MSIKRKLQQIEAAEEFFDFEEYTHHSSLHKNRLFAKEKADDSDMKIWNGTQGKQAKG